MWPKFSIFAILSGSLLLPFSTCRADLLLYDGFDYPAPGRLAGNGSGLGWSSPWADSVDPDYQMTEVAAKSLDAPANVGTLGNQINLVAAAWHDASFTRGMEDAAQIKTAQDAVYYFSFLFKLNSLETNTAVFQFQNSSHPKTQYLQVLEHFGLGNGSKPGFELVMNDVRSDPASGPPLTAQTYFVLVKLVTSASGKGTANLYVYPSGSTAVDSGDEAKSLAAATWTVSLNFTKNETYDQLAIFRWSSSDTLAWDEIRMGTTFADAISGQSGTSILWPPKSSGINPANPNP